MRHTSPTHLAYSAENVFFIHLYCWPICAVVSQVGYAITKIPDDFTLHKGVKRVYEQRRQMIESGEGVDWGTAEALAFGTLLSEGMRCPF